VELDLAADRRTRKSFGEAVMMDDRNQDGERCESRFAMERKKRGRGPR
jgi:hypothetical protein